MIFSNIANRSLSSAIARIPMIQFRYGASRDQHKVSSVAATPGSAPGAKSGQPASNEPIYDFQIPQRWRRRPISEEEIAYINRGGPE